MKSRILFEVDDTVPVDILPMPYWLSDVAVNYLEIFGKLRNANAKSAAHMYELKHIEERFYNENKATIQT